MGTLDEERLAAAVRAGLALGVGIGFLLQLWEGGGTIAALVAAGSVGHGLSALVAIRRESRARLRDERDQIVLLQIARDLGGALTPIRAAIALQVTHERARDLLDELARQGLARVEVDEDGTIAYVLDGVRPRARLA